MNNELNFERSVDSEAADQKDDSLENLLHGMVDRIRQSLELSVILSSTVAEVRALLNTDRVKIYQFAPDSSGEVVAESVDNDKLPSLLGQHFPPKIYPCRCANFIFKSVNGAL